MDDSQQAANVVARLTCGSIMMSDAVPAYCIYSEEVSNVDCFLLPISDVMGDRNEISDATIDDAMGRIGFSITRAIWEKDTHRGHHQPYIYVCMWMEYVSNRLSVVYYSYILFMQCSGFVGMIENIFFVSRIERSETMVARLWGSATIEQKNTYIEPT